MLPMSESSTLMCTRDLCILALCAVAVVLAHLVPLVLYWKGGDQGQGDSGRGHGNSQDGHDDDSQCGSDDDSQDAHDYGGQQGYSHAEHDDGQQGHGNIARVFCDTFAHFWSRIPRQAGTHELEMTSASTLYHLTDRVLTRPSSSVVIVLFRRYQFMLFVSEWYAATHPLIAHHSMQAPEWESLTPTILHCDMDLDEEVKVATQACPHDPLVHAIRNWECSAVFIPN